MASKMITKTTVWVLEDKDSIWYGTCIECKGAKSGYTPQMLRNLDIKPCSTCSNVEEYEKKTKQIKPKEEPANKAKQEAKDSDNAKRLLEPLDVNMNKLKVGDKVRLCSACHQDSDEKIHAEVLSIEKYHFKPENPKSDSYSEKEMTTFLVKIKDLIAKETYTTIAGDLEKV